MYLTKRSKWNTSIYEYYPFPHIGYIISDEIAFRDMELHRESEFTTDEDNTSIYEILQPCN